MFTRLMNRIMLIDSKRFHFITVILSIIFTGLSIACFRYGAVNGYFDADNEAYASSCFIICFISLILACTIRREDSDSSDRILAVMCVLNSIVSALTILIYVYDENIGIIAYRYANVSDLVFVMIYFLLLRYAFDYFGVDEDTRFVGKLKKRSLSKLILSAVFAIDVVFLIVSFANPNLYLYLHLESAIYLVINWIPAVFPAIILISVIQQKKYTNEEMWLCWFLLIIHGALMVFFIIFNINSYSSNNIVCALILILSCGFGTKIKTRYAADKKELELASNVQLDSLTKDFVSNEKCEVFAQSLPAKEVGGDFYDCYFIDDENYIITIGDVSGKGMSAALFMMKAMTVLRDMLTIIEDPAVAVAHVNDSICRENEACLFVTVFVAKMNIVTGKGICVNAGHNPPVIFNGKSARWLRIQPGLVLGAMEGAKYTSETIDLMPGDTVYLYTDGVTEAFDKADNCFGEKRLLEAFDGLGGATPKEVCEKVSEKVSAFTGNIEQSDDITMCVFKFKGSTSLSYYSDG